MVRTLFNTEPRITLVANYTSLNSELFVLQSRDNPMFSAGAGLLQPIFLGGLLQARVNSERYGTAVARRARAALAGVRELLLVAHADRLGPRLDADAIGEPRSQRDFRDLEVACARDGTILAIRGEVHTDMGAYMRTNGAVGARNLTCSAHGRAGRGTAPGWPVR